MLLVTGVVQVMEKGKGAEYRNAIASLSVRHGNSIWQALTTDILGLYGQLWKESDMRRYWGWRRILSSPRRI